MNTTTGGPDLAETVRHIEFELEDLRDQVKELVAAQLRLVPEIEYLARQVTALLLAHVNKT